MDNLEQWKRFDRLCKFMDIVIHITKEQFMGLRNIGFSVGQIYLINEALNEN